jgi:ubiquinone/menaquinone biosynthesis C-methylase UbiE
MGSFTNFADKKLIILDEMKRVLKRSGTIIISAYSEERMKLYNSIGLKIKEVKDGSVYFENISKDNVSEQFTQDQLESIFKKANLQIVELIKTDIAYICVISK